MEDQSSEEENIGHIIPISREEELEELDEPDIPATIRGADRVRALASARAKSRAAAVSRGRGGRGGGVRGRGGRGGGVRGGRGGGEVSNIVSNKSHRIIIPEGLCSPIPRGRGGARGAAARARGLGRGGAAAAGRVEVNDGNGGDLDSFTAQLTLEAERLNNSQWANSTMVSYSCYVGKFAWFLMRVGDTLLEDDLKKQLLAVDECEWCRTAADYYMMDPMPRTRMFILEEINEAFGKWIAWMEMKPEERMSDDAYSNARSAIASLFVMFNAPRLSFSRSSSKYLRGVKVRRAKLASQGLITVKRAKDPLTFQTYCYVAKDMLYSWKTNALFAHAVLTTMWNLMSRVENCVNICKSHIETEGDALLIYFAHEKTDQTQSKPGDPKHIYANPKHPEICPILSLGLYFLENNVFSEATPYIFTANRQDARFDKILGTWLDNLELKEKQREEYRRRQQQQRSRGGRPRAQVRAQVRAAAAEDEGGNVNQNKKVYGKKYGTHSIRKGSATYASSCCTNCPSLAAIYNRAGWTLGVPSIYMRYEASGDQYVGRIVSGLNGNDAEFAILPPTFVEGYEPKVREILTEHFPNYDDLPFEIQKVIRMTMASVVYHLPFIRKNELLYYSCCRIRSKKIFTKDYGVSLDKIVEIREWKPGDPVKPTGIPPYVNIIDAVNKTAKAVINIEERQKREAIRAFNMSMMLDEMNVRLQREDNEDSSDNDEEERGERRDDEEEEHREQRHINSIIGIRNGNNGIRRRRYQNHVDDTVYNELVAKYDNVVNSVNKLEAIVLQQQQQIQQMQQLQQQQIQLLQQLIPKNKRLRLLPSQQQDEDEDEEMNDDETIGERVGRRIRRRRNKKDKEGIGRDVPVGYEILAGGTILTAWIQYFVGNGELPAGKDLNGRGLSRELSSTLCKYKKLMKGIVEELKEQGIWAKFGEPKNEKTATIMLQSLKNSKVIPRVTRTKKRVRRLNELTWITLASEYYRILRRAKLEQQQKGQIQVEYELSDSEDHNNEEEEDMESSDCDDEEDMESSDCDASDKEQEEEDEASAVAEGIDSDSSEDMESSESDDSYDNNDKEQEEEEDEASAAAEADSSDDEDSDDDSMESSDCDEDDNNDKEHEEVQAAATAEAESSDSDDSDDEDMESSDSDDEDDNNDKEQQEVQATTEAAVEAESSDSEDSDDEDMESSDSDDEDDNNDKEHEEVQAAATAEAESSDSEDSDDDCMESSDSDDEDDNNDKEHEEVQATTEAAVEAESSDSEDSDDNDEEK